MLFKTRHVAIGGVLARLGLLVFTAGPLSAQTPTPGPAHSPLHEQMHRMMDGMMGAGFAEQMHQAMPGSEEMMEQCARMMDTMETRPGMRGGMIPGMGMMGGARSGMMDPQAMRDMMHRMMGR